MIYNYKTKPYNHQKEVFELSRDETVYALFMEMGTGKSKVIIDTIAYNYLKRNIFIAIFFAPIVVHTNWLRNEIPAHLPDNIKWDAFLWEGKKTKKAKKEFDYVMNLRNKLTFLIINIDALSTDRGKNAVIGWINHTIDNIVIIDESSRIKTPNSRRTKNILKISKQAYFKRILTGTPITNNQLDLFSQFAFLGLNIIGEKTFWNFQNKYAKWETQTNWKTKREYRTLIGFSNTRKLIEKIKPYTYYCKKSECLDLPDKIYERILIEFTPKQQKLYEQIKRDALLEITGNNGNSNVSIITPNVLSKLIRLRQVTGGFLPKTFIDENAIPGEYIDICDGKNPRLKALIELCQDVDGKILIWSVFRPEIKAISDALKEEFGKNSVVEYHGGINRVDRINAVNSIQCNDTVRFFIGQPQSGGIGLTLTGANTVIYYSNSFNSEDRWQSEDRAHRIGQTKNVTYFDFEVEGTTDTQIIHALIDKKDIATSIVKGLRDENK